jgi:gamma-glutamyl:cysteine ligase YbdK (ATP-grasp superfamily)
MGKLKLGPELELLVLNDEGELVNRAADILREANHSQVYPEFTKNMVEIGCRPSHDLREIEEDFSRNLAYLVQAAERLGLKATPITSLRTETPIEIRDKNYYKAREIIFGRGYEFSKHSTSTHVHVDLEQDEKDIIRQFHIGIALDPSFVFMSSSPYYRGRNTIKDMRVLRYRNDVYRRCPRLGALVPYPHSLEELSDYFKENLAWLEKELGRMPFEIGSTKLKNEFSAFWGNPRLTLTPEKRTIEIRAPDANNFSNIMAYIALLKGIFNYVHENEVETKVEEKRGRYFTLEDKDSKSLLVLPPFGELKRLEFLGYRYGFESKDIRDYCANMLSIAKKGLEEHEQHYLAPFIEMLEKGRNYSDEIAAVAHRNGYLRDHVLTIPGATQLRLKAYQKFIKDLEGSLS